MFAGELKFIFILFNTPYGVGTTKNLKVCRDADQYWYYLDIVDDGHWEPLNGELQPYNTLTMRHSAKADVEFADGHVQIATYKQAQITNNVIATY